jgi:NitT/TauT family transport system permease protein
LAKGEILLRLAWEGTAASEEYRKALAITPGDPAVWTGLAEAQLLSGTPEEARQSARKALELDPASADAHAVLGLVNSYSFDFTGAETVGPVARGRPWWEVGAAVVVAALLYEAVARTGYFPPALMPTLPKVWNALIGSLMDGSMIVHAASTLYRVLVGLGLAVAVGLPLGILMARWKPIEHFFMPLVSALMPIPSLAWVPVFILWFGLGNATAIGIVFYAALFPMLLNAWSGVRAVNPLWLRAAGAMGANERALFWKVSIPGAFPFLITGLRQAFLRAWIAVVGAEMLAASDWGLGWVIFDAKEFLKADVMLASLAVIGLIGFAFERLVFGTLERATVQRWGMVRAAKG